jgi:hypothetical protein
MDLDKSACMHRLRPEQRAGIGSCLAADGPGFRGSVSRIGADQVSIGELQGSADTAGRLGGLRRMTV